MSKELTPLKALQNLTEYLTGAYRDCFEELSIIETALKDYELMKQAKIIVADKEITNEDLEKLKNQRMFACSSIECKVEPLFDEKNQNQLKALDIIKEIFKIKVSIDENENDKSCGMVFLVGGKDIAWTIYETFDKENIQKLKLLKEVLL